MKVKWILPSLTRTSSRVISNSVKENGYEGRIIIPCKDLGY